MRKNIKKGLTMNRFYLIALLVLTSCGHGKLEFQSFPEKVDVSVVESDGQIKNLGETPLNVDMDQILFGDGAVKLLFTKAGYRDETVYLSKPALRANIKISTNMKEASSAKEIISNQKLEKLSNKVAEAQKYTYSKNYKRAEGILLNLIDEYPEVSVPYDLLANIYYLSNNTSKALFFYEKAKGLSPSNTQREYLINKLKREIAGRGETEL